MILSDLIGYVRERQVVCLEDVATHFDVEAEAARGMLDLLVAKGRVSEIAMGEEGDQSAVCGGCSGCCGGSPRAIGPMYAIARPQC